MFEFQTLALNRLGIMMVVDYYDDEARFSKKID
jgi:hypothetical protein